MTTTSSTVWDLGSFETIAPDLAPAAADLISAAAIRPGERVLDVGCGTGTAALLAADAGGRVSGIDPAARLLSFASGEANRRGLTAAFVVGEAADIPRADDSADVVVSNFGLIFAPDPQAAVAEISRVAAPDARVVFTAWLPGGALNEVNDAAVSVVRRLGAPAPAETVAWHDPDAMASLFGPYGFTVMATEHELEFTAASPEEYLTHRFLVHPFAVASRPQMEKAGVLDEIRSGTLDALQRVNTGVGVFRMTAPFVVVSARRGEPAR